MVKIWLDKSTQKKIQIMKGNGYKVLSKIMKDDDIPWFLGGKCKEPINSMPGIFSKPYLKAFSTGELIPKEDSIEIFYETDKEYLNIQSDLNSIPKKKKLKKAENAAEKIPEKKLIIEKNSLHPMLSIEEEELNDHLAWRIKKSFVKL
jgi:hypothetical protein